jgi:hypothetical protein
MKRGWFGSSKMTVSVDGGIPMYARQAVRLIVRRARRSHRGRNIQGIMPARAPQLIHKGGKP